MILHSVSGESLYRKTIVANDSSVDVPQFFSYLDNEFSSIATTTTHNNQWRLQVGGLILFLEQHAMAKEKETIIEFKGVWKQQNVLFHRCLLFILVVGILYSLVSFYTSWQFKFFVLMSLISLGEGIGFVFMKMRENTMNAYLDRSIENYFSHYVQ